jgi:hypothetical protein
MTRFFICCVALVLCATAITMVGSCGNDPQSALPERAPAIDSFTLTSYKRIDDTPDAKGLKTGYIVDSTITVRAHSIGMSRIDVHAYRYSIDPDTITASGKPDKDGWVTLSLTLPERGVGYVVDANGVLEDQASPATYSNERNEKIVVASGFHVIVRDSES